jgi:hypothetical protein
VINVDELLTTTLKSVGVPVKRLLYDVQPGEVKPDSFITFLLLLNADDEFADDDAVANRSFYRADVFAKSGVMALVRKTRKALKAAGFYGVTVVTEIYEESTGYHHVPVEFYFMDYPETEE